VRPTMRVGAVKTAEQQAAVLLHRGRERLVCHRTGLMNVLRGHLAEFGINSPQGLRNVGKLRIRARQIQNLPRSRRSCG
jgi:transposase